MPNKSLSRSFTIALALCAPVAAQNCFDGAVGTLLAENVTDYLDTAGKPIGFPFPIGGVTYSTMHITDHGYIQFSNAGVPPPVGGTALYTPTTANFAASSAKVCALYSDTVATNGGRIYYNNAAAGRCVVTWQNMQYFGAPASAPRYSFQAILYPTGDVIFVYGANVTNNSTFGGSSDNGITGISPGGNVILAPQVDFLVSGVVTTPDIHEAWLTPNTFDLANNTLRLFAATPGYTYVATGAPANCAATSNYGTGCFGLALTGAPGAPSIGNNTFELTASGVPAVSPIGLFGFGDTVVNPGLPLGGIGMPTCSAYTNLNLGLFGGGPAVGGVSKFPLPIPNSTALVGAVLSSQAVALSLSTPLNLVASNGTKLDIGFGP